MQELARISRIAAEAAAVDSFAKRVVHALVNSPAGEWSSAVAFQAVQGDPHDVVAIAHRRKLRFEFVHHLVPAEVDRAVLAGRFHIYDVDRDGNFTGRDETVDLYPPSGIMFSDGKQYQLPDRASTENAAGVRDGFARLAAKISQSQLFGAKVLK